MSEEVESARPSEGLATAAAPPAELLAPCVGSAGVAAVAVSAAEPRSVGPIRTSPAVVSVLDDRSSEAQAGAVSPAAAPVNALSTSPGGRRASRSSSMGRKVGRRGAREPGRAPRKPSHERALDQADMFVSPENPLVWGVRSPP